MTAPRIPLNFFGIPFGLAGLAGTWRVLSEQDRAPAAVSDALLIVSAMVWVIGVAAYARHAVSHRGRLVADVLDPVAGPFASLVVITPMLWAVEGVYPHAETAGRVMLDVFLVLTVLLGAWFTGQWIYGPLELDKFHPGYFLPTAAGGLVASIGAATVGQRQLAEAMFGLGTICWLVLGSLILGRLFFRPLLPPPLLPTLAIEVAPAAVASLAHFALNGGRIDTVAALLAGYGALMALAQLRLLPAYARLPFMPSTWAFTFSWAAVATAAVHWLQADQPAGYVAWEYVVLALITVLVGGIAARTVVAVARGTLLPPPAVPAPSVGST
jgi:tellurite resistance protein